MHFIKFGFNILFLQAACKEVPPSLAPYTPGIAFIVVSKHKHTFTLGKRYNFFLVSQKVTKGTVFPTRFNVVEDSTGISPDIQQRLAYALTNLYFNCQVILNFCFLNVGNVG